MCRICPLPRGGLGAANRISTAHKTADILAVSGNRPARPPQSPYLMLDKKVGSGWDAAQLAERLPHVHRPRVQRPAPQGKEELEFTMLLCIQRLRRIWRHSPSHAAVSAPHTWQRPWGTGGVSTLLETLLPTRQCRALGRPALTAVAGAGAGHTSACAPGAWGRQLSSQRTDISKQRQERRKTNKDPSLQTQPRLRSDYWFCFGFLLLLSYFLQGQKCSLHVHGHSLECRLAQRKEKPLLIP